MAFERTLLERIARPEENVSTINLQPRKVADSVLSHLDKIMNTREGSCAANPDYGLPDFNDLVHRFPDAIYELRRAIKRCIEKFEPRLTRVKVSYAPDDNNPIHLRFEITANLVIDGQISHVLYETTLDSDGRARIRG